MTRVPRWGVHQGIKYSPRRSVLKICPICKEFFLKNTKGKRVYCNDLCSVKAKQEIQRNIDRVKIRNRDKFEHANYMQDLYAEGRLTKRINHIGTDNVSKPQLNDDGTVDWYAYHKILHGKLQKLKLGSR